MGAIVESFSLVQTMHFFFLAFKLTVTHSYREKNGIWAIQGCERTLL